MSSGFVASHGEFIVIVEWSYCERSGIAEYSERKCQGDSIHLAYTSLRYVLERVEAAKALFEYKGYDITPLSPL